MNTVKELSVFVSLKRLFLIPIFMMHIGFKTVHKQEQGLVEKCSKEFFFK